MDLPESVLLCEVGPRDGFQFEDTFIPTDLKVALIEDLVGAGLRRIQAVSFVHPKWVPQMADAEGVVAALGDVEGVTLTGLVLNQRGLERAHAAGMRHVDISIATNEQHSRDNANKTVDEGLDQAVRMVAWAGEHGMQAQMGFQTVFGYATPGDTPLQLVLAMAERFAGLGIESLSLADTTGLASPLLIQKRVTAVRRVMGEVPLVLHLHDTRGLGLANIYAALEAGVTRFDTSLAGMGGCPFIPGAAGNVPTEDVVFLMDQLGIETGVDLDRVAACSIRVEDFLEKRYPGKVHGLVRTRAEATA